MECTMLENDIEVTTHHNVCNMSAVHEGPRTGENVKARHNKGRQSKNQQNFVSKGCRDMEIVKNSRKKLFA